MRCEECKTEAIISQTLPYCSKCIRDRFKKLYPKIIEIHVQTRKRYGLAEKIPDCNSGKACRLCINNCHLGEGEFGYCGVRQNAGGKIIGPDKNWAYLDWYHDPLPTNCVADWVCEGNKDYGYKNLAVFYEGCTFNCLFCQNWHYRDRKTKTTTTDLASAADPLTNCICFFGGDPTPFALHSIAVTKEILERKKNKRFRVCWETNGSVSPKIMRLWIDYALKTDGCIKIDFKAFSEEMNIALCSASRKNTKENIKLVAQYMEKRERPPLLIVSTLLTPGYIDETELTEMAKFLNSINKGIPWSFLGFYPHFFFSDLPRTSWQQAEMALNIAKTHGLENTHIGNVHLLI